MTARAAGRQHGRDASAKSAKTSNQPVGGDTTASRPVGMLIAPGAGSSSDHPSLIALDDAISAIGLAVARIDFPYRLAGRRAPDRPRVLIETIVAAANALAARLGVAPEQIVLAGRSMGGRMCAMAVAEGQPAAGLVLISYPLHAPGRREQPRSQHFPAITVPSLFISGDRDAFGSPQELQAAITAIPAEVTHEVLPGGDHSLRRKDQEVAILACEWVRALTVH